MRFGLLTRNLDLVADKILADIKCKIAEFDKWAAGYVMHFSTYINGSAWEDEFAAPKTVNQLGIVQEPYLTKAEIAQRDYGQGRMREMMRLEAVRRASLVEVAQTTSSCPPEHPTSF